MTGPVSTAGMAELWARGEAWQQLLDTGRPGFPGATRGGQRGWLERFNSHDGDAVNGSGRQRGKSFAKYAMLDAHMRKWPGARTRYCALTIDTAQAILMSAMGNPDVEFQDGYLATCPANLRPHQDGYDWIYPGGSRLVVMGTDAQTFRRGRGFSRIEREVRDEFCFYQDLDGVEAALNAGLMIPGVSGQPGRCWRASTPALTNAHPSKLIVDAAKASGRYEHETLYDNPRVDPDLEIRKQCELKGCTRAELLASTWFRREYLGEWVTEESRAAMPAWNEQTHKATVMEWKRPQHFDGLVSVDWGGYSNDPHAALFGYLDFEKQFLVIEAEYEKRGVTLEQFAKDLKAIEGELWGVNSWDGTLLGAGEFEQRTKGLPEFLKAAVSAKAPRQPFLRVCDTDEQLQLEMMRLHGYALLPTQKTEKHLAVDEANNLLRNLRVRIHPRCRRLIEQLYSTLWNLKRTEWERTAKDHGDLIDTFIYKVRNVFWHHDPRPPPPREYWGQPKPKTGYEETAAAMTGRRKR